MNSRKLFPAFRWVLLLALSLTLNGCHTAPPPPAPSHPSSALQPAETNTNTNYTNIMAMQSLLSVLWYQRAAECQALCYQACNIARARLDRHLATRFPGAANRPSAIIVDIDETVLDNSPYQAGLAQRGEIYSESTFDHWVQAGRAEALPGLAKLLNYAKSNNVEVFYISNRKQTTAFTQQWVTITNLFRQGLPWVDEKHVLLQTNSSSKDDRRGPLLTNGVYDIVFLMGDNLADFHHDFEGRNTNHITRAQSAARDQALFGDKYIVLPNPMYGDWENALYDKLLSPTNKVWLRKEFLRAFDPDKRVITGE